MATKKKATKPKKAKKKTRAKKEETTGDALNRVARTLKNLAKREGTLSLIELAGVLEDVAAEFLDEADDAASELYDHVRHEAPASAVLNRPTKRV